MKGNNMSIRKNTLIILLAAGLFGVAGCGSSSGTGAGQTPQAEDATTSAEAPETEESETEESETEEESAPAEASEDAEASGDVVITVKDFAYQMPESVSPGATITVVNEDSTPHSVTSDEEGLFDVTFKGDETATFTAPEEPGEYPYVCIFHGNMKDTLVVK